MTDHDFGIKEDRGWGLFGPGGGNGVYSSAMSGLLSVICGAVIGASGRYLLTTGLSRSLPGLFPWGTLVVNWVGCLVIGLAWGMGQRALWSPHLRTFLFVGILGSFTTFSSFGLETMHLLRGGDGARAAAYVLGSNFGGLVRVWLGLSIARGSRWVARSTGGPVVMNWEDAVLVRVFVGESQRFRGRSLSEAIVLKARELEIAGATVLRGVLGYGGHHQLHAAKLLSLSEDLPLVVEIVEDEARLAPLLRWLEQVVDGGLVTAETVRVLRRPDS